MFKCIVLVLSAAMCAYAAVGIFPYEPKPAEFADREGCYSSSLKTVLPYDEPYYPKDGSCTQYKCFKSSNTIQVFSCGAEMRPAGCKVVSYLDRQYPDCCPVIICD